jgi:stage V sporulation protein G
VDEGALSCRPHITDIRIMRRDEERLLALATVTFDDCFVVRGVKVIQTARGLLVAMPSRRRPDGVFQDVAHPIHAAMRAEIEARVLARFNDSADDAADAADRFELGPLS